MKSKRALMVLDNLNVGGAQNFVIKAFSFLKKNGWEVDFLVNEQEKGYYESQLIESGCSVFHLPNIRKHLFSFRKAFKKIVKDGKYDVIHCHMNYMSIFPLMYSPKTCVRICHAHANYPPSGIAAKLFRNYFKNNIRKYSDYRLGCSEKSCEWLYGNNSFCVIDNGIDLNRLEFNQQRRLKIRNDLGIEDDEKLLICVGNLYKVKRHTFLIDAFALAHCQNPKLKLIILGSGDCQSEIEKSIQNHKLNNSVLLLGLKTNVEDYLSASDLFVLASLHEGFPISILEACANGLNCLISDSVELDNEIKENIIYADANDSNKYSDSIIKSIFIGRNFIPMKKYDFNISMQKMIEYYNK